MVHGVALAAENPLERRPEFRTEDGINDGIQSRIEVSQPQEERD